MLVQLICISKRGQVKLNLSLNLFVCGTSGSHNRTIFAYMINLNKKSKSIFPDIWMYEVIMWLSMRRSVTDRQETFMLWRSIRWRHWTETLYWLFVMVIHNNRDSYVRMWSSSFSWCINKAFEHTVRLPVMYRLWDVTVMFRLYIMSLCDNTQSVNRANKVKWDSALRHLFRHWQKHECAHYLNIQDMYIIKYCILF